MVVSKFRVSYEMVVSKFGVSYDVIEKQQVDEFVTITWFENNKVFVFVVYGIENNTSILVEGQFNGTNKVTKTISRSITSNILVFLLHFMLDEYFSKLNASYVNCQCI